MQNCLCIKVRFFKYLPHFARNMWDDVIGVNLIQFYDIFQRYHQMLLKVMKQWFLSFLLTIQIFYIIFILFFLLLDLLKLYRCRIMRTPKKFMLCLIKKELRDVVCRFCIVDILDFLIRFLVVLWRLVYKNFVNFLHICCYFLKLKFKIMNSKKMANIIPEK